MLLFKKSGKPLLLPLDIMTSSSWRIDDDISLLLHHYLTKGNLTSQWFELSPVRHILRFRFINKPNLPNWEHCVFIWWSTVLWTRSVCVNVCFLQLKSTHRAYPFITFLYWAIKIFCDVYCEDNVVEKGMVWFHIMIIRGSKILKGIIS